MRQVIVGGWNSDTGVSSQLTTIPLGVILLGGGAGSTKTPIPATGSLTNFRVSLLNAGGSSQTFVFTNETTGLSVSVVISAGQTTASSSSTLAFTQGDLLSLACSSAITNGRQPKWSFEFQGSNANEAFLAGTGVSLGSSTNNSTFFNHPFSGSTTSTTESERRFFCPIAGTIKSFYSSIFSTTPLKISIYKNGSIESSSTLDHGSGPDLGVTGLNIPFSAGDTITIGFTQGVAAVTSPVRWSIMYNPTTDGESMYGGMSSETLSSTQGTVEYDKVVGGGTALADTRGFTSIEVNARKALSGTSSFIMKNFRVDLASSPGTSQSRILRIRKNGSNTTLIATVSGSSTTAKDNSNQVLIEDQDLLTISHEVATSGVNTSQQARWSWVQFIDPAGGTPVAAVSKYNAGTNGKLIVAPQTGTGVTGTLDMTGLTDNREYDFPNRSGIIVIQPSVLTATRVVFVDANGDLTSDADLTFVTDTLTATKIKSTDISPSTDDGGTLGTTALKWSDLFLASGSVINFNSGDVTIIHSANALDIDGGVVDFGSVPTVNSSAIARAADNLSFFAATTSAQLAGVISDETGSGALVFASTPTLITPTVNSNLLMGNDSLIQRDVNAGLTASTTQTQGQGALTAEINEVATVAVANDTVTLPSAVAGLKIVIINNGANTLQIFPALGDNLGAGVDTATTLAVGSNVVFVAYNAVNWKVI